MKILYVISRLDAAGPVNQLFDLVTGMDRKEFDISIVTMEQESNQSRWQDFEKEGFALYCLHVQEKLFLWKRIRELNRLIEKIKPDLIHSECLPADLVVSKCEAKGAKKITTMHCDIYTDYPILKKGLFAVPILPKLMLREHENCLKKFDLLIGCSFTLKTLYEQHYANVCAIQNGIATERFFLGDVQGESGTIREESEEAQEEKKKQLGLLPKLPVVMVVGSLDFRKNTEFIVKNLRNLTEKGETPFQLVFLGTGEKEEEYKQLAEGRNIFFKGKVSNVEEYLRLADVYLSASQSEGLPLSVLEAGCCGLRMVLSDISQHKEMVGPDGLRGIHFFEGNNEGQLQQALEVCLAEPENRTEIGKYFRERFSAKRMQQEYMETYRKLATGSQL